MKRLYTLIAAIAVTLSGCAGISPDTALNAARGHAEFPALSVAIAECTAERPDVQAEIEQPFNTLADMWLEAKELEPNVELLIALANARPKLQEAEGAWLRAKSAIVASGLDCGLWVQSSVKNIEDTFTTLTDALDANANAVMVLDYAQLLAGIFVGRDVEVRRL